MVNVNCGKLGAPSPSEKGEGQCLRGRDRTRAPAGLPGVWAVAPRKDRCLKVGKVWSPAKTRPYGKDLAYNRKKGEIVERIPDWRLRP